VTNVGLYSISNRHDSGTLTRILSHIFKSWNKDTKDIVITDGTAGIGGNTLSFSNVFKRVNSIEMDPIQFEALKHNVNVYRKNNIPLYNADCLNLIPKLDQNAIFVDPPWGGKSYKNEVDIDLTINDVPMIQIVNRWKKECKDLWIVAVKIPKNFALQKFANLSDYPFIYLLYFRKYNVVILSKYICKTIEHRQILNYVKKRRNSI
jgi:16S rRNA G966 N2-methylase RsmD